MCSLKLIYFLGVLIFRIRASSFEGFDLLSFDIPTALNDILNSEEVTIPNYDNIEDILTSFQPQNLEISDSSSTLHSEYEIGEIVRLRENPQLTLLIEKFNEDKSGYVVTDEGTLQRYYVYASQLEKCPKSQIDEYNEVKKAQFPIVGKRFILGGTLYKITNVSIENREVWIEDVISGDSYHYRFNDEDKATLLYKLSLKHVKKKLALQSQDNIDHFPIPTPTSTEPTYREVISADSNEQLEEEPWKNFERFQIVQKEGSEKKYAFMKITNRKLECCLRPLTEMWRQSNNMCDGLRAVTSAPEELKDWVRTGAVLLFKKMYAKPGDILIASRKYPGIIRSFILVSFSAEDKGRCLLTDESGTRYYVIMCNKLSPL